MYLTVSKLAQDALFPPAAVFIVNIIKTNKVISVHQMYLLGCPQIIPRNNKCMLLAS